MTSRWRGSNTLFRCVPQLLKFLRRRFVREKTAVMNGSCEHLSNSVFAIAVKLSSLAYSHFSLSLSLSLFSTLREFRPHTHRFHRLLLPVCPVSNFALNSHWSLLFFLSHLSLHTKHSSEQLLSAASNLATDRNEFIPIKTHYAGARYRTDSLSRKRRKPARKENPRLVVVFGCRRAGEIKMPATETNQGKRMTGVFKGIDYRHGGSNVIPCRRHQTDIIVLFSPEWLLERAILVALLRRAVLLAFSAAST